MKKFRGPAHYAATYGILLAFTLILSYVETFFPPILPGVPGVKVGLSNIIIMYCVIFYEKTIALQIAVLKSFFVFILRGGTAFLFSFFGSITSAGVMIAVSFLFGRFSKRKGIILISILGAVTHNITQLAVASVLTKTRLLVYYLPILIISALIFGGINGGILKALSPYILKIKKANTSRKG